MAPQLPHNKWVANRHFTSRCDFCDKKNTVLQHCNAQGCQINICEPCMRSDVLAKDKKHKIGADQADGFEWQRKILPREDGPTAQPRAAEKKGKGSKQAEAKNSEPPHVPYTHPGPHFPAPEAYGPGPLYSTMGAQILPGLPSLPMAFPHGSMYFGQAFPTLGNFQPLYAYASSANGGPGLNPPAQHVQPPPHMEPEVRHKTSPKHVKKGSKHRVEESSAEKVVKRKRPSDVAEKAPPEASARPEIQAAPVVPAALETRPKTPEQLDESEDVIMAANILMAMSRGTYATDLFATPPISVAAARPHLHVTPAGDEPSSFLPTPGPDTAPKPKSKKGKQAAIQSPTPDEDIPWNPLQERIPITKVQWNERDDDQQLELSARAQALRNVWERITIMVLNQFGLDDDEELFAAQSDQFRVAWERMMDCMPDMSDENRLNRSIAIAVVVEAEILLKEALAVWE